jgi:gamma-glutamylcysteine synthetase
VLNTLIELFDKYSYEDIELASQNVPKYALEADFGKTKIKDLAKEILILAKDSLKNDEDIKIIRGLLLQHA